MTPLLEKTYERIRQLPEPEQDRIASVIMEQLDNPPANTPQQPDNELTAEFTQAASHVLKKNAELYRRLAG